MGALQLVTILLRLLLRSRAALAAEIRALIRRMSRDNPTWGRRRIRAELHLPGYEVGELTMAKYVVRRGKPPSQGWRAFLNNHARDIAAIDFFTVPTVNLRILICFVVLRHHRRTVVHFNVTSHPTQRWTAQQIVEAFPYDMAFKYLLRDRDRIYGSCFGNRVRGMGIEEILLAPRSPFRRAPDRLDPQGVPRPRPRNQRSSPAARSA